MSWKKLGAWLRSICCNKPDDELSIVEYTMADPDTCYRPSIDAPPSDACESILVFCAGQMKVCEPAKQRSSSGDEEAVQGCMLFAKRALKQKHQPRK